MYLPESHTDFIFPIVCEELGAVFGALIIVGYGVILLRIYRIAKSADNLRTSIIAYGAFWYFALHIIINLLGILALIPLTGVPLPFLSYGGSYTLNAIVLIFVVERVAIENKKNKLTREIAKI
jgi:cell division protein FtsW (lipid II flippase)